MGIERFTNSIIKNKENIKYKIAINTMLFDLNAVMYKSFATAEEELNHLIYDITEGEGKMTAKSIEVAKKWNFEVSDVVTIEMYEKHFTEDLKDTMAILYVKREIFNPIDELTESKNITRLILAPDGIPTFGKMIEQRKRRYNAYVINKLKKKLYEQYQNKLDKKRQLFEKYRYGYNRNKIFGYSAFMKRVAQELSSDAFKTELKLYYPSLIDYKYFSSEIVGEGEKKIMEYILKNKLKGVYAIYSPDADVIILSMIMAMQVPDSHFYMLHYEQNKKEYTVIDINELCTSIFDAIKKKVLNKRLDIKHVIMDLCMIFTVFGNDFLPKIESIDVRKDFNIIIDKYAEFIDKSNHKTIYLTNITDKQIKINYLNLRRYLNKLAEVEDSMIKDTYMSHAYNNYRHLKESIGAPNMYLWMKTYVDKTNKLLAELYDSIMPLNRHLEQLSHEKKTDVETLKKELRDFLIPLIDKIFRKNTIEYIQDFVMIESERNKKRDMVRIEDPQELHDAFDDLIKKFYNIVKTGNKLYVKMNVKLKLKFNKYDDDVTSKYHSEQLEKMKVHEDMVITDYDRDLYRMERMIGRFKIKLNAMSINIGMTMLTINKVSETKKYYQLITTPQKLGDNSDYVNYYTHAFDTRPNSRRIDEVCEKYIKGMFNIVDFYMNKNNTEQNYRAVSTWFYDEERSPMLREIVRFLNTKAKAGTNEFVAYMNNLYNNVAIQLVSREDFLTQEEHYWYITPKNSVSQFPEYLDKITPNLDILVDKIWNNNDEEEKYNTNIPIDCTSAPYLSKCHLAVPFVSFEQYIAAIRNNRKKYEEVKQQGGEFKIDMTQEKLMQDFIDCIETTQTKFKETQQHKYFVLTKYFEERLDVMAKNLLNK
jgi:5'-3' exonuclease